jgi:hypothetical protein
MHTGIIQGQVQLLILLNWLFSAVLLLKSVLSNDLPISVFLEVGLPNVERSSGPDRRFLKKKTGFVFSHLEKIRSSICVINE